MFVSTRLLKVANSRSLRPLSFVLTLHKGIGMLKLGRIHRQTGEKFVGPTAMSKITE